MSLHITDNDRPAEKPLAKIEDLSLLYYSGLFANRTRNPAALEQILGHYFGLPMEVIPFQGQWLYLDKRSEEHHV